MRVIEKGLEVLIYNGRWLLAPPGADRTEGAGRMEGAGRRRGR